MPGIHAKHYHQRHRSQLAKSASFRTHQQGCTWTTGSNGIAAATGGRLHPSPDTVLSKVATREQTDPGTPGWSLPDLDLAVTRLGVNLEILSGWDKLIEYRNQGYYIALQGDEDVFDAGCMSKFDGDHCIGIHPDESPNGHWRVNDPLCPRATHRDHARIREYAQKFANTHTGGIIRFGVFKPKVPLA